MSSNLSDVNRQRELHSVVSNSEVTPINISDKLKEQSKKLATLTSEEINARITELNKSVAAEKKVGWWSRGTDKKIAMKAQISNLKKTQKEILKLKKKLDASKEGEAGIKEVESVSKKIEVKALTLFPKPFKTLKTSDPNLLTQNVWKAINDVDKSTSELVKIYKTQINECKKIAKLTDQLLKSPPYNIDNESNKFEDEIKSLKKQCDLLLNEIEKMDKIPYLELGNKEPLKNCAKIKNDLIEIQKKYKTALIKSQFQSALKNLKIKITLARLPLNKEREFQSKLKLIKYDPKEPTLLFLNVVENQLNDQIEIRNKNEFLKKISGNPKAYIDEALSRVERLKQKFDQDSSFQFNSDELETNKKIIQNFDELTKKNLASNHSVIPELTQFEKALSSVRILDAQSNLHELLNDLMEDLMSLMEDLMSIDHSAAIKPITEFLTNRATLVTNAAKLGEDEYVKALSKFEYELDALNEIFKGSANCMSTWISQEERFLKDLESGAGNEIDLRNKTINYNNLVDKLNKSTDIKDTKTALKKYLSTGAKLEADRAERNAGWEFISERKPSVSESSEDVPLLDTAVQRNNSLSSKSTPSPNRKDVVKEAEAQRNELRSKREPSVAESEYDELEYEWPDDKQNPDLHRTNSLGSESSASRERSSSVIDPSNLGISELKFRDRKTDPVVVQDSKTHISEKTKLAESTQDLLKSTPLNMDMDSNENEELETRKIDLINKINLLIEDTKLNKDWLEKLKSIKHINQVSDFDAQLDKFYEKYHKETYIRLVSEDPKGYFRAAVEMKKHFGQQLDKDNPLFKICPSFVFYEKIDIINNFIRNNQTSVPIGKTAESIKFGEALYFLNQLEIDFSAFNEINKNVKKIKEELDAIEIFPRGKNLNDLFNSLRESYQEIISLIENTNPYNPPNYIEIAARCKALLINAQHINNNILKGPDADAQEEYLFF